MESPGAYHNTGFDRTVSNTFKTRHPLSTNQDTHNKFFTKSAESYLVKLIKFKMGVYLVQI